MDNYTSKYGFAKAVFIFYYLIGAALFAGGCIMLLSGIQSRGTAEGLDQLLVGAAVLVSAVFTIGVVQVFQAIVDTADTNREILAKLGNQGIRREPTL